MKKRCPCDKCLVRQDTEIHPKNRTARNQSPVANYRSLWPARRSTGIENNKPVFTSAANQGLTIFRPRQAALILCAKDDPGAIRDVCVGYRVGIVLGKNDQTGLRQCNTVRQLTCRQTPIQRCHQHTEFCRRQLKFHISSTVPGQNGNSITWTNTPRHEHMH